MLFAQVKLGAGSLFRVLCLDIFGSDARVNGVMRVKSYTSL